MYGTFLGAKWIKIINVVVPSESKLTVATCNWTRAIKQIQTTHDGVNGGTLPCVWLVHATPLDSVTNNLTYLPSTTSWMTDSTCWVGQEYRLASDVQRRWKKSLRTGSWRSKRWTNIRREAPGNRSLHAFSQIANVCVQNLDAKRWLVDFHYSWRSLSFHFRYRQKSKWRKEGRSSSINKLPHI